MPFQRKIQRHPVPARLKREFRPGLYLCLEKFPCTRDQGFILNGFNLGFIILRHGVFLPVA